MHLKQNPSIIIVPATPADVQEMQEVFYRAWLSTYPNEEFGITVEDVEDRFKDRLSPDSLAKREERIANPPDNEITLLAKDGEKVIGLCRVIPFPDRNQLQAIYVHPDNQGQGVGRALWNEARKSLDPTKITVVHVATYNTNAINFYEKIGFRDNGKRWQDEKFRLKSGAIIPEMEMVLQ